MSNAAVQFDPNADYAPAGGAPAFDPNADYSAVTSSTQQPSELAPLGNQQPVQMVGQSPAEQAIEHIKNGNYWDAIKTLAQHALSSTAPIAAATGAGEVLEAPTIIGGLATAGRTLLGGVAGAGAGRALGREVGGLAGPEGAEIGGDIGAAGGALIGGGAGARLRRNPYTGNIESLPYGIQKLIPDWMVPRMTPEEIEANQVARGVQRAKVAQQIKQSVQSTAQPPAVGVPVATLPGVSVIPEPRPTFEGEQPNYMASVPRSTLPKAAAAGKPGAGTQLQQLGKTVIYAPSGAGIESPNITALQERMSPAAQEAFGPQLRTDQFNPDTYQVSVHQGGLQHGHVMYTIGDDGTATVNSSLITDEMQGKHLGVAMYKQAIENARAAGASSFQSGDAPEPGAVHAWESLRKSYPVEKVGSGYRIDLTEQPALAGK